MNRFKLHIQTQTIVCLLLCLSALFAFASCGGTPDTGENKTYTFQTGNLTLAVNADVAPLLTALGAWKDYDESPSCGFTGMSKIYTYSGFEIETYPSDNKDLVYMIQLYDDTVSTPEGIRVGSSADAVKAAYGTPNAESTTALTYQGNGMYLRFLLKTDGSVSKIRYLHPNAAE